MDENQRTALETLPSEDVDRINEIAERPAVWGSGRPSGPISATRCGS
jgi:hypothetical protein